MISAMALTVPTFNDIRTWILDIEATKHVTGNPKLLSQLRQGNNAILVHIINKLDTRIYCLQ